MTMKAVVFRKDGETKVWIALEHFGVFSLQSILGKLIRDHGIQGGHDSVAERVEAIRSHFGDAAQLEVVDAVAGAGIPEPGLVRAVTSALSHHPGQKSSLLRALPCLSAEALRDLLGLLNEFEHEQARAARRRFRPF